MGEQMRKAWDRHAVVAVMVVAVLMGIMFGHTISNASNKGTLTELVETQRKERATLIRAHKSEKKYLREQLAARNETIARQSDQLANLAAKAADGNKAAMQLMDKQTPEATTK